MTATTILGPVQVAFKEAMARVSTPVAVVTATGGDRSPYGTTVSAFMSLSMSPPLVLVSLDQRSQTLGVIRETRRFGLNILASGQEETALVFAGKGGAEKFRGITWEIDEQVPRVDGTCGWVACTLYRLADAGDHVMIVGTVVAAEHLDADPLTYRCRAFGTHRAPTAL